ncbi:MAG: hypothetical protein PF590_00695 [Candidatus Delongbacteria bacterium]|nr:hypothetical protein [Candidatus Delongbacteria bacterium]
MEKDNYELVTLALFKYAHRANILQSILHEAGIESVVTTSSVFKQIDSIKLQVNKKDLSEARRVLQENRGEFGTDEIEEL